ncbi:MAG: universal stress protein [Candidatus Methanomethylicaceae archaeon]
MKTIFKNILVPIDGSPASMRAVDLALEFGMRDGAKITLMHVIIPPPNLTSSQAIEELKKAGESVLEAAESRCKCFGLIVKKILRVAEWNQSSVASEIYDEAVRGRYDLAILGSRGYSGERGILMGSVTISLAVSLPCTIIIVR